MKYYFQLVVNVFVGIRLNKDGFCQINVVYKDGINGFCHKQYKLNPKFKHISSISHFTSIHEVLHNSKKF